ncbi:MAG TPA: hypothetical protein VFB59_01795 [Candidatus Saccharimonadales bacterium]|nr:hypothetical protein [Candidatus Saccharimonadales bacterium]
MLLLHIIIALFSVGFSTYLYFSPSRTKLKVSYALVLSTVATGTYLVVVSHAAMLRTCMTGLLYVGVTSAIIVAARHKLAVQTAIVDKQR